MALGVSFWAFYGQAALQELPCISSPEPLNPVPLLGFYGGFIMQSQLIRLVAIGDHCDLQLLLVPKRLGTKYIFHHIIVCQLGGAFPTVRNLGSAHSAVCPSQNGGLGCERLLSPAETVTAERCRKVILPCHWYVGAGLCYGGGVACVHERQSGME